VLLPSHLELQDLEGTIVQSIQARGEIYESPGGKSAYYVARLRGLQSGHQYRYRVCTNEQYSDWYAFTIHPHCDASEFLFVGDIQDTIAGIANQLLKQAFQQHPHSEFLVCGGDLIERPLDCYWDEMFKTLDSIAQVMPILTITGNHDYWKGVICQLDPRFWLVNSFYQDSRVDDNQVFSVRYDNIQFFCLDSNREFWYLWQQRDWLKHQLADSDAKWKIMVLHHPLYSLKGSMNNLIQRWMFDDLLQEYGVDLVLQGHEHAYARMRTEGKTIPVYTVSHCSPKNYRIEFDERFDRFGSGSRYYQKVSTHGDTLFMTAYDAVSGMLYDSLQIQKQGHQTTVVDLAQSIPEVITFIPDVNNRKDCQFAERIQTYKDKKGIK
jgi:3',5'-cyclic AMP phosphodiesterase CpdA